MWEKYLHIQIKHQAVGNWLDVWSLPHNYIYRPATTVRRLGRLQTSGLPWVQPVDQWRPLDSWQPAVYLRAFIFSRTSLNQITSGSTANWVRVKRVWAIATVGLRLFKFLILLSIIRIAPITKFSSIISTIYFASSLYKLLCRYCYFTCSGKYCSSVFLVFGDIFAKNEWQKKIRKKKVGRHQKQI